jgi:hypothetical protein
MLFPSPLSLKFTQTPSILGFPQGFVNRLENILPLFFHSVVGLKMKK